MPVKEYTNRLINEKSPYLLQHAHNPVDWYPWGDEAFNKAKTEDKPVFLSIGYSTCHWCHVMAHESFEDEEIAKLMNEYFVNIKVDREERPDIDIVYMEVCQALTGSGGWPMSVFLTPDKKPFFAGTYFPKDTSHGMPGFRQLLESIANKWQNDRSALINSAEEIIKAISPTSEQKRGSISEELINKALKQFNKSFDEEYGGFGGAPKFPTPHNLLFLLSQGWSDSSRQSNNIEALHMVEVTLQKMYRGGLFDHIGFGFSRYSTDRAFLIPHFEKMLYDNALLIMAYVSAYDTTNDRFYLDVAEKTADFILSDMTSPDGCFYSALDADSDGKEGAFYTLSPEEIIEVLGEQTAKAFNCCYGITEHGNFEDLNIPHLVGDNKEAEMLSDHLSSLRAYRKKRYKLHLDDKILTSWNGLLIAALSQLARVTDREVYLNAAIKAEQFLKTHLEENNRLFVSWRDGQRGSLGFLDDYAYTILGLINLSQATQNDEYLSHAQTLCEEAFSLFEDTGHCGFYLSGNENESLILRPKETYDGAMPSGNSVMAYNLLMLSEITEDSWLDEPLKRQLEFLSAESKDYPMGHSFFMLALSYYLSPPDHVTVVTAKEDTAVTVLKQLPLNTIVKVLNGPTKEYGLIEGKTTYYVCSGHNCLPPTNNPDILKR